MDHTTTQSIANILERQMYLEDMYCQLRDIILVMCKYLGILNNYDIAKFTLVENKFIQSSATQPILTSLPTPHGHQSLY